MAAPIYNPVIPCIHPIPNGMYPGRMIRVQGSTPPGAQRFAINLQCGPNTDPRDDIALHLNFRFVEMCVVRNHLTAMAWGNEETSGGMPLTRGDAFEALILCEPNSMKIALNGMHFCEFPHRVPLQRISHLTVDGDVMVQFIGFEGAQPPPQQQMYMQQPAYGTYGAPPPAYGAPGYGAPQGFGGGAYETQPTYVQQDQQRRGLGTGAAVGLGVGALAAGGLAGYALGGGFSSDSPDREENRQDFSGNGPGVTQPVNANATGMSQPFDANATGLSQPYNANATGMSQPFDAHAPGLSQPYNANANEISQPFDAHAPGNSQPYNANATGMSQPFDAHAPGHSQPYNAYATGMSQLCNANANEISQPFDTGTTVPSQPFNDENGENQNFSANENDEWQ